MNLKSLSYNEQSGGESSWELGEFLLGPINLVVGKNATGKTRTLNVIQSAANLVSGEGELYRTCGDYGLRFEHNGSDVEYLLDYRDGVVEREELLKNGKHYLRRAEGGRGVIRAEALGVEMEFQAPVGALAAVVRRDAIQHPFFEDLYHWGASTKHYRFGSELGKGFFLTTSRETEARKINIKSTQNAVAVFRAARESYGEVFVETIIDEMGEIGYPCDLIGVDLAPSEGLLKSTDGPEVEALYLKEKDLTKRTWQHEMSQGLFRALSLIVQLNYSILEGVCSLVLIDDIGEGLDFDRSVSLIQLLMNKASHSGFQLIMSTNDRFVMNSVPLKYWSVIQRMGLKVRVFNYSNAREVFDDFEFTGLSNFDFLATEFYEKGFDED